MVWLTCSETKLTHIMKNMSSCKTMSSRGVRFGSALLPSLATTWAMTHLPPLGRRFHRGRRHRGRGRLGAGHLVGGRLLRVVEHLRQQVVGDVAGVERNPDKPV